LSLRGELERVRREVEQHAVQRARMSHTEIRVRHLQHYGEPLLFGHRLHYVAHRLDDIGHRERDWFGGREPVAAARELDHVARHRAETEGGAVDQTELPLLHVVHGPALSLSESLREEEDRRERGSQVVTDFHEELETAGAGEAAGEAMCLVAIERRLHPLERLEESEQLAGPHALLHRAQL